jgi:hypothetical protein
MNYLVGDRPIRWLAADYQDPLHLFADFHSPQVTFAFGFVNTGITYQLF